MKSSVKYEHKPDIKLKLFTRIFYSLPYKPVKFTKPKLHVDQYWCNFEKLINNSPLLISTFFTFDGKIGIDIMKTF